MRAVSHSHPRELFNGWSAREGPDALPLLQEQWRPEHEAIMRWIALQRAGLLPTLWADDGRYKADGRRMSCHDMEILIGLAEQKEEEQHRLREQQERLAAKAQPKPKADHVVAFKKRAGR